MIIRLAWFATLAAIAAVTFALQLDRQARKTPSIATSVPQSVRSSAQLPVAAYALQGEDTAEALAQAELLVRRRPMPAEHLRVLAQAQFAAGNLEEGGLTIQYAAQRGWRDMLAQESMLRIALNAGDEAEAARRYAALFVNQATKDDLLIELGRSVLAQPGGPGRETMSVIVAGADRWHRKFLRRAWRVMPADAFVEILTLSATRGAVYECDQLQLGVRSITARDADAAEKLNQLIESQC
ncbi:MAG: hypothetical protein AAFY07_13280 [Pseudomonadota bacterium]